MCQKCSLTATECKARRLPQYVAAVSVCLGSMASGAATGWTGNISDNMKTHTYNGIEIDDDRLGWIGSMLTLGMTVACIPLGQLCDVIGRKSTILSVTIPFIIGAYLTLYASCLSMLYIGRFLTGAAASVFIVVGPVYITEIAQKEIRGALGSYIDLFLTVGNLLAYLTPMVVDMKTHTIIVSIIPLIFAASFVFQPESPVFRIQQDRKADAKAALIRLRGKDYCVDKELSTIQKIEKSSIIDSLKKKGTQKAAIACFGLMFFQAMTGIYPVLFYTDTIFKTSRSKFNPKTATVIVGMNQVMGEITSSLLADRISRRTLLMFSNLFVAISVTVLGMFFSSLERELVDEGIISSLNFVPLLSLSIFIYTFSLAMGPIPWVINSELFPAEIKGPAMGATAMFNSLVSFATAKLYFCISDSIGVDMNYYIFAIATFVAVIFTYFCLPETRGKTLEEIQREINE